MFEFRQQLLQCPLLGHPHWWLHEDGRTMLGGIEVRLGVGYLEHKAELDALADKVVYTGSIDACFNIF